MPELRSGARRSKRLGDLQQPAAGPNYQEENWLLQPTQNRTRRRGGGRGRGNAVAKGPSAATPGRPAGRGRGIRLIDLDPEPPCEAPPQAVVAVAAAGEPALNRVEGVADKDIAMEGGSADKIMGVEEESSTTPVPERVLFSLFTLTFILKNLIEGHLLLL